MATQVANPLDQDKVEELIALRGYTNRNEVYREIASLVGQGIIWDYLSFGSLLPVVLLGLASVGSLFISLHLLIDKLFFKEFYRPPNLAIAIRRAVLVTVALASILTLRFLGIQGVSLLAPLPLAIVVEWLISAIWSWLRTKKDQPDMLQ